MDENNKDNFFTNMAVQIATNWASASALKRLLIEKGIITDEEFTSKFNEIYDGEIEKMAEFFKNGKTE